MTHTSYFATPLLLVLAVTAHSASAIGDEPDYDATFITPQAALENERIATRSRMTRKKPRTHDHPLYNFVYEDFVTHGLVVVSVMSDSEMDFELWNGLDLINVKTKKTYGLKTLYCVASHCTYVGKLPMGEYFIDRIYANAIRQFFMGGEISQQMLQIRNALSRFSVTPCTVSDLGMIGVYGIEDDSGSTKTGLFVHRARADHQSIVERVYGQMDSCIDTFNSEPWLNNELHEKVTTWSTLNLPRFLDFSKASFSKEDGILAPTALGRIVQLDRKLNYTVHELGTMYALFAVARDSHGVVAGGEAGLVYTSTDPGSKWTARQLFDRDELVAEIYPHDGQRFFLTITDKRRVHIYRQRAPGSEPVLLDSANTVFSDYTSKAMDRGFWGQSTTDSPNVAKTVTTTTRINTRNLDVEKIGPHIFLGFDEPGGSYFDIQTGRWTRLRALDLDWIDVHKNHEDEPDGYWDYLYVGPNPETTLRFDDGTERRITGTRILRSNAGVDNFRANGKDIRCHPYSNMVETSEGEKVIHCAPYVVDEEDGTISKKRSALYAIDPGKQTISDEPYAATDNIAYYFDTELMAFSNRIFMIDRIYPRVHVFSRDSGEWTTRDLFVDHVKKLKVEKQPEEPDESI